MSKHRPPSASCRLGLAAAALLSAGMAGCAAPPPPAQVAGAPVPLVKYDGNYQGRARLVSSRGMCPTGSYGVIEIADHTLNFAYLPDVIFVADVAPNGAVHEVAGTAVLDGKIADGRLAMTITTPQCQTAYDAHVIWNHG